MTERVLSGRDAQAALLIISSPMAAPIRRKPATGRRRDALDAEIPRITGGHS